MIWKWVAANEMTIKIRTKMKPDGECYGYYKWSIKHTINKTPQSKKRLSKIMIFSVRNPSLPYPKVSLPSTDEQFLINFSRIPVSPINWKLKLARSSFLLICFWYTISKIPKFHLNYWCGNFLETHSDSPETLRKLCVFTKFIN